MNGNRNKTKQIVTIQIEDDEELTFEMIKEKQKHTDKYVENCTQTDNSDIITTLKVLMKDHLNKYQGAFIQEDFINKKIDPSLIHLQQENVELKKELNSIRARLEQVEQNRLKRTSDDILSPVKVKKQTIVSPSTTNLSVSHSIGTSKLSSSYTVVTTNQTLVKPPVSIMPSQAKLVQQRFKAPVQLVTPVQHIRNTQPLQRHLRPINEKCFLVVDENNKVIGTSMHTGVNTQVVAANHGLRMTSLTPRQVVNGQYQQLVNIPGLPNSVAMQQQTSQQTVRHIPRHIYQPILPSRPAASKTSTKPYAFTLPKLKASISASGNGIILTWDFENSGTNPENHRKVECYHLFAHQAKDNVTPPSDIKQWKKIGVVNALPLPMACTLTQFATGNVYFFAVLAVDIHGREGELSNPCIIRLNLDS